MKIYYLLAIVQTENTMGMNEVICPWVSRETFTPEIVSPEKN